jgi:CRP-like cAMP-binding protein
MHEASRAGGDFDERQRQQVAALRQVDFLAELSDDDLALVLPSVREVVFGRGEIVCREGEPGETFYLVRQGTVEVQVQASGGGEAHLADLHSPAFFGEMSLLTGEPRSATVRAKTDVRLLVLDRRGFEQLFQSRPSFAEEVCRVLGERQTGLRELRDQTLATDNPETRTRRLLTRMQAIFRF